MSQGFDPHSKATHAELPSIQGARILAALEAVRSASARTSEKQKAAFSLLRRQSAELEAVQEAGQRLGARGRDIRNSLQLLRESLDRAKLTALNAGLEGARLGEPMGKVLVAMGDEVRNLLARAVDAIEEHATLLAEADRDRDRCLAELAHVNDGTREVRRELEGAQEQGQIAVALLGELRTDLGEAFGTDPEAAQLLASSAGQVRDLASSLVQLSERTPLGVNALRELLDPLLSLVAASRNPDSER
jgi:methyl-accepting chemotaxis protein